ncbi:hypothetical protein NQ318_011411, partial [Aromia moschata]
VNQQLVSAEYWIKSQYNIQNITCAATSSVPLFTRSKLITSKNVCEFILRRNRQDTYFVNKILFTDEATFTRRGIFNRKNCHIWADQNPNANWVRHFQYEFKINIWCGIIGDYLVGPFELTAILNGQDYLNFLQENLVDLLEEVPLDVRANMWFRY